MSTTIVIPEELAEQIAAELSDPNFSTRTHGTRSCVNAGCSGPLCSKFNRDRQRKKYEPISDRARPGSRTPELDQFLDNLIALQKGA